MSQNSNVNVTNPTINVSMERNSRGVTWGVSIVGARDKTEAMAMLDEMRNEMEHRFGAVSINEVMK